MKIGIDRHKQTMVTTCTGTLQVLKLSCFLALLFLNHLLLAKYSNISAALTELSSSSLGFMRSHPRLAHLVIGLP